MKKNNLKGKSYHGKSLESRFNYQTLDCKIIRLLRYTQILDIRQDLNLSFYNQIEALNFFLTYMMYCIVWMTSDVGSMNLLRISKLPF